MANIKIDEDELRALFNDGRTYAEIAAVFNVSVGGIQQALDRLGLTKRHKSHKKYIPWTLAKADQQTGPAVSLRNLSRLSHGDQLPVIKRNSALRWLVRLHEAGLDICYTQEDGFFEKPADEGSWHIKMIYEELREVLAPPTS